MPPRCLLTFLALVAMAQGQGDLLTEPTVMESSGGSLDITLNMNYADVAGPHYTFTNARLFEGTYPGPTIKISPGDNVRILFKNNLSQQSGAVLSGTNVYHKPDTANIHFHGGHVSGELPSDDVREGVSPGSEYQYETLFPSDHMGGTHWIHPHFHGSSALQVGAGACMALIVKDADGFLPSEVLNAPEKILFVHNVVKNDLETVISEIQDTTFSMSFTVGNPEDFRTVNGQYQPAISMQPNEWQRWRIIWADWLGNRLNFAIDSSCQMRLLAKDGIYIQDYPRTITTATIPTGGRADIMVRCESAGNYTVTDYSGQTLMIAYVSGTDQVATDLTSWTPTYPTYLTDLTSTAASTGCTCSTSMARCPGGAGFCVNDNAFDSSVYLHKIELGSIVERTLGGVDRHPYHHHVNPGLGTLSDAAELAYFVTGDWHDVASMSITGDLVVRFSADTYTGTQMLHCHILSHEDKGTMAQEIIVDGGSCECDLEPTPAPSLAPSAAPDTNPTPTAAPVVLAPTNEPPTDPSCFSSQTTVEVLGKGNLRMTSLSLGDKVYIGNHGGKARYEAVYSFGHYQQSDATDFLRIHTNSTVPTDPIELTPEHLIYIDGCNDPVRADAVQVGTLLLHQSVDNPPQRVAVTRIDRRRRYGSFLPMTQGGTIVVNGITVSAYVSIHEDAPNIVKHKLNVLSEQRLFHWWLAPYRFFCTYVSPQLCQNDYNSDGVVYWLAIGRFIAQLGEGCWQGFRVLGLCIFIPMMALWVLVDSMVNFLHVNLVWALWLGSCLLVIRYLLRKRSSKEKME
ncbi:Multicopper oxidase mco [Seminavis robusta]|uniref:Multicopper oxidase mco n=1 Tax=Seminavis robusta TaxID=568900 RepID=A0A9N8DNZ4_9STRA|nr:Multicopper oxidase mco [Seminavis robusta]|eukprot:Sro268_g103690.1 Multicopper oxidase mco (795) ;mRNA; r:36579-39662